MQTKYVEVWINFPDTPDETIHFCVNSASKFKAIALAKTIAKEHGGTFTGHVIRKTKEKTKQGINP